MTRPTTSIRARGGLLVAVLMTAVVASGCSQGKIDVDDASREGAVLFNERCSGCHTFSRANSFGSKPEGQLEGGERTNGPSFDIRRVDADDALYAIRNGGFAGTIMPANIVVGEDAEKIAELLDRYSGEDRGGTDVQAEGEQTR